jgi:hypothetical protein
VSDGGMERYQGGLPLSETLEDLERMAEGYFRSARAPNTAKAFRHALEHGCPPPLSRALSGE